MTRCYCFLLYSDLAYLKHGCILIATAEPARHNTAFRGGPQNTIGAETAQEVKKIITLNNDVSQGIDIIDARDTRQKRGRCRHIAPLAIAEL